jgi:hypothetical protein
MVELAADNSIGASQMSTLPRSADRAGLGTVELAFVVPGSYGGVGEVNEHVEPEELQRLLERDLGPDAKDAIMTAGQRLIEQGRQQGIEQGRQRFQEMLLGLLRQRFGNEVDAQVAQRVATASFEQIEAWSTRVLSASTLADLFAD